MANLSHLPEQWRQSGLTQREFCKREGISIGIFSYWRSKELRSKKPDPQVPKPTFSEVVVQPDTTYQVIEISYPSGTVVRIPMPAC